MGTTGAQAFAEEVNQGNVSLRDALSWHLSSNHYPPHPAFMIPVAERAIELANEGTWDEDIDLPDGVEYKGGTTIPVYEAIEAFHLDSFIDYED